MTVDGHCPNKLIHPLEILLHFSLDISMFCWLLFQDTIP